MSDIQKSKKYFKKEDLMKRLDWLAANAEIHNDLLVQAIALDSIAWMKEQEAKYGYWITIWREDDPDTSTHARCSICNRISERPLGEYCKWCGAKMEAK